LKLGGISQQLMSRFHSSFVKELDWATLSCRTMVALMTDDHLATRLSPSHLEMLLRDALKRVLGNGDVEEKRGSSGDLIAQVAFDLEFHVNGDSKN
jgi:hypothetical protein